VTFSSLKVLLLNARSIKGKLTEIQALSPDYNIVCITETHIDSGFYDAQLFLQSDKVIYRKDRTSKGGGVLVAIDTNIPHTHPCIDSDCEIVCVNINLIDLNLSLICYYRPPAKNDLDCFFDFIRRVKNLFSSNHLLLLGDFNMPGIDWKDGQHNSIRPFQREFLSFMDDIGLVQIVDSPTHIGGNILDLIFTDLGSMVTDTEVIQPGISDHFLVTATVLTNIYENDKTDECNYIFKFHEVDALAFETEMEQLHQCITDLVKSNDSIDTVWNVFRDGLHKAVRQWVPTIKRKIRPRHEPVWYTLSAKRARTKERKLYSRMKKSDKPEMLCKYKAVRRQNKKLYRKLKRQYFTKTMYEPFKQGNTKPFFKYVKGLKGNNNAIHTIEVSPGCLSQDKLAITDSLNQYFHSVFSETTCLPSIDFELTPSNPITITKDGVLKLLNGLKTGKAPGPDGLTKNHLCLNAEQSAVILAEIFNMSLSTGTIPSEWKEANVTPIFKSGSRTSPSNYRPVSLTNICCKVMEHIVLHYLNQHLQDILCHNQHGFRKSLSCNTQLLTVVNDIVSSIDKGSEVHGVVLDFSKAFDLVPHDRLIQKLIFYGFDRLLVQWIADFLHDRSQRVVLDGVASSRVPVTSGVPQGSVLGPSLFLLYINDIVDVVEFCTIKLFADDTLIYTPINSIDDTYKLQKDLDSLLRWSIENGMSFNTRKSSKISFGSRCERYCFQYNLGGTVLAETDKIKYLGIIIQNNLKWDQHIDVTIAKASRILGLIKHTIPDAPTEIKKLAYKTLCRPILEYGSDVWDPYVGEQIYKLEMLQNKAVRFIFNIKGRDESITLVKEKHHIQSLSKRRKDSRILTLISILSHEELHPSLSRDLMAMKSNDLNVTTRSSSFNPIAANTTTFLNSFIPRTTRELRLGNESS